LLLVLPIVLWVLPASFFDKGQSLCLSVLLLDKTCYGCGITRAVQHCMHGDFLIGYAGADYFNGQIPVVKIYNRALTQTEVAQNYNAIKSRFNLA
jgi:hypothetical protein